MIRTIEFIPEDKILDVIASRYGRIYVHKEKRVCYLRLSTDSILGPIDFLTKGVKKKGNKIEIVDRDMVIRDGERAGARWFDPDINVMLKVPLSCHLVDFIDTVSINISKLKGRIRDAVRRFKNNVR